MEKTSNFQRFLNEVEYNRNQEFPCIPTSIPKLNEQIAGITQSTYFLITANSKIGKTQFTDSIFLYDVIEFINNNETDIKVKIFYYSMEMSEKDKIAQAVSRNIFIKYGKSFDTKKILGLKKYDNANFYNAIKQSYKYWEQIEANTEFIYDNVTPTDIYKKIESYAQQNGTIFKKKQKIKIETPDGIIEEEQEVFDKYIPNNKNEYVFIIKDSLSLLNRDRIKVNNNQYSLLSLKETIEKMSRYDIMFRNNYGYIPVNIQQQSAATENPIFYKGEKLISSIEPSISTLGETNLTGRDASVILGLFNPYLHNLESYRSYDYSMKDTYRDLSILRDRSGSSNLHIPLFFNGASNIFKQL